MYRFFLNHCTDALTDLFCSLSVSINRNFDPKSYVIRQWCISQHETNSMGSASLLNTSLVFHRKRYRSDNVIVAVVRGCVILILAQN